MPSGRLTAREGDALVVGIADLVGHTGRTREFSGSRPVSLELGESTVDGLLHVAGSLTGTTDGVQAEFTASAVVHFQCVRCLAEWDETLEVAGSHHFSVIPDEDGYTIEGATVDMFNPAKDELSLAIPPAPLCDVDCRGLCPICGTDLNSDPCDGHGEESDSPFAVLKDLFES